MKCVILKIEGRVQGVFFRASTKKQADALGINGFVKNEVDGGVYIEAEGDEKTLHQFIEWCRVGPLHAAVSHVKITATEPKQFSSFKIVR